MYTEKHYSRSFRILFKYLENFQAFGMIQLLNTICNPKRKEIDQIFRYFIKMTGIAFLTEFAVSICKDSLN